MTRRFNVWSTALLLTTLAVILWGAFVRVTGSGAGCADHWPLCNGELVPRAPKLETLIELTHRVTSGLAGLLSIVVYVLARRGPKPLRRAAAASLILMLLEGAIGALLVKRGLVAKDPSAERAFVVGLHLCNTFLLLGAQVLTVHLGRGGVVPRLLARGSSRARTGMGLALLACLVLVLMLGATGAITALGDTLFPAASLREGLAQDLSASAHFLVRLRVYHPLLAMIGGALVVYVAQYVRGALQSVDVTRWAWLVTAVYITQLAVGSLNLFLLAPAPVQLAHLLLADLLWLSLVMLSVYALAADEAQPSLASAAS